MIKINLKKIKKKINQITWKIFSIIHIKNQGYHHLIGIINNLMKRISAKIFQNFL